jgi:hypothetical protein
VFGLRYLPFDEEQNLLVGRSLFALKLVITLLVALVVYMRISSTPQKDTDVVKEHESKGEVIPTMSVHDYDKAQLVSFLKAQIIPTAITLGIHYKFNYVQPLYIQAVMSMISLYDWNLFQIYMLKKDGTTNKALKRPFVAANAPGIMESMNKKVQEASEEADKKAK